MEMMRTDFSLRIMKTYLVKMCVRGLNQQDQVWNCLIVQRTTFICTIKSTHTVWGRHSLSVPQATHSCCFYGCSKANLAFLKDSEFPEKRCKLLHAVQIDLGSRAVCLGNSEVSRHVTAKAPFFTSDLKQSTAVICGKQLVLPLDCLDKRNCNYSANNRGGQNRRKNVYRR